MNKKYLMLVRMWSKENTRPLQVGMQTWTASVEISRQFLRKMGTDLPQYPAGPLLGVYSEGAPSDQRPCPTLLIAALSITARDWKQARRPSTDKGIKKTKYVYLHTGVSLSHLKEPRP